VIDTVLIPDEVQGEDVEEELLVTSEGEDAEEDEEDDEDDDKDDDNNHNK
jgi:hypothetical protein